MSEDNITGINKNHIIQMMIPFFSAGIFIFIMMFYFPFREKIQFDTDEGLNLMRSMLVSMNHPLYSEVSSDQPPLFTHLLVLLFKFSGYEVNPARLLVLLFAGIIVWSGSKILQLAWGNSAAILFLPLIFIVPNFLRLSVSVMIGIPSLAIALISLLYLITWHKNGLRPLLFFSGLFLALSMMTKLFTGFLAPIFLFGIYFFSSPGKSDLENRSLKWLNLLTWSLSFGITLMVLGLILIGPANLFEIITPHVSAMFQKTYQKTNYTIVFQLTDSLPLLLSGSFGAIFILLKKKILSLYLAAWVVFALVLLNLYTPILYHHQLLVTLPAALLSAIGLSESVHSIFRFRSTKNSYYIQPIIGIITIFCIFSAFRGNLPLLQNELSSKPQFGGFELKATAGKIKILSEMNKYASQTNWIVTDMPIYAFLIKKPVPPILATYSRKRYLTGSITSDDVINSIAVYNPEQVMIARFKSDEVDRYLINNYSLIASPEFFRLFIRNDLRQK